MNPNRTIRIIKRGQRARAEGAAQTPPAAGPATPSEREVRTVVSAWVREHQQRTEEFRRTFAATLRESGFSLLRAASRA